MIPRQVGAPNFWIVTFLTDVLVLEIYLLNK